LVDQARQAIELVHLASQCCCSTSATQAVSTQARPRRGESPAAFEARGRARAELAHSRRRNARRGRAPR
jgi:hypothetical protein